ncbi:Panacea domain-containing protein [Anaerophilus nitritogenes]|uniref:Panacea domain-containing protein n=1 Tax=Anaerophilus nitritogenes TaxID=2498136 RepID=UPI00101D8129|nr:type II toxin-antitoxin system antitoxin SocA domain-containing protein [Anaerophilus nitritogenes]
MKREITIFDIAKTFLTFESMTNKKLQKLCYYAQAWYLTLKEGTPLADVDFEAWVHGPVCPELYHFYKDWGFQYINKSEEVPEEIQKNKEIYDFIEKIYEIYGDMDGDELEALTHNESPWINGRNGLKRMERSRNIISREDMINFCSNILK